MNIKYFELKFIYEEKERNITFQFIVVFQIIIEIIFVGILANPMKGEKQIISAISAYHSECATTNSIQ